MSEASNNNDPIEELFRRKAKEYDIEYREADWLELESRLDKAEAKATRLRRRRWIAAASILLLSLIGYFTYENYQAINQINEQLSEQSPAPQQEAITDEPSDNAEGPINQEEAVTESESTYNNQPQDSTGEPVPSSESAPATTNQPQSEGSQSIDFAINRSMAKKLYMDNYSCSACSLSGAVSVETMLEPTPFLLATSTPPEKVKQAAGETGVYASTNAGASGSNASISTQASSPFSIGLVAGPDLSTVGSLSHFSNPGYKYGIAVEYRLTPNLAINSGVGQANVHYTAQGREYKPPYGYWTNGVVADQTIADCAILEIPINLKYDVFHFKRSRIYASAGLSSYVMLNEEYRFNYNRDDTGLVQGWGDKTGTKHWLSTASLAVGYELDVLPHWSLRAEPFVKLPLKEVGWGNVKLYSIGTSISLNFNP